MESRFCRKNTTREYLHSDLTIQKMFEMFKNSTNITVSYQTYVNVWEHKICLSTTPRKTCVDYVSCTEMVTRQRNLLRLKKAEAKKKVEKGNIHVPFSIYNRLSSYQKVIVVKFSTVEDYNFTVYNLYPNNAIVVSDRRELANEVLVKFPPVGMYLRVLIVMEFRLYICSLMGAADKTRTPSLLACFCMHCPHHKILNLLLCRFFNLITAKTKGTLFTAQSLLQLKNPEIRRRMG